MRFLSDPASNIKEISLTFLLDLVTVLLASENVKPTNLDQGAVNSFDFAIGFTLTLTLVALLFGEYKDDVSVVVLASV